MQTLSYTQEYFMCAVNNKGNIPVLKSLFPACLVAGGIMELRSHGYIAHNDNGKLAATNTWGGGLSYLKPLYETIANAKKPIGLDGIAEIYAFGLSQKPFNEYFTAIGVSLVDLRYADELAKQGLLKETIKYVPKAEAVTQIIEKVRAEFLEDGTVTEETLCLATLLDKGDIIRDYFSKVEKDAMKKRIKEVRKSEAAASVKELFDYVDNMSAAFAAIISVTS